LDPTLSNGELAVIRDLDLRAFDVIGWNVTAVPEPSTMLVMLGATIGVAAYHRKRATKSSALE